MTNPSTRVRVTLRALVAAAGILMVGGTALCASAARARFPFVDQAARRPDFVRFRQALIEAVGRRDVEAVIRAADPGIDLSFGDSVGLDAFRDVLTGDGGAWENLAVVLKLGGTWADSNTFHAPYVYSAWPEGYDSFEHLAVVGSNVLVRAAPRSDGVVLDRVSYSIVKMVGSEGSPDGWTAIELGPAGVGYIDARYLSSPIGYRAGFHYSNGRWKITFFVAGD